MFSLIITIIAIALVAALALASIYYGGSAFNKGTAKAQASALVNNAMQISAAKTLATADGVTAADAAALVAAGYLASAPAGMDLGTTKTTSVFSSVAPSAEVCAELPQGTAAGVDETALLAAVTGQYACVTDNALTPALHFVFK